jgi:hypothetical protein
LKQIKEFVSKNLPYRSSKKSLKKDEDGGKEKKTETERRREGEEREKGNKRRTIKVRRKR